MGLKTKHHNLAGQLIIDNLKIYFGKNNSMTKSSFHVATMPKERVLTDKWIASKIRTCLISAYIPAPAPPGLSKCHCRHRWPLFGSSATIIINSRLETERLLSLTSYCNLNINQGKRPSSDKWFHWVTRSITVHIFWVPKRQATFKLNKTNMEWKLHYIFSYVLD